MSDDTGVYNITGANMSSVTGSRGELSGNLNVRRGKQRLLYDRRLQGTAYRWEVGEPSSSVTQPATPPSWTQRNIGKAHAYVIATLSSSTYENFRLNTYTSGVLPVEVSPVPASASAHYSKASRFVKLVYKLSASANLPLLPTPETGSNDEEVNGVVGSRANFVATSGSYRNSQVYNPSFFDINVPVWGKIRDVRVWVELINDTRQNVGSATWGLGGIQLALRSPNVTFNSCFPLWNDDKNKTFGYNVNYSENHFPGGMTGSSQEWGNFYTQVPEMYRSSYILWNGLYPMSTNFDGMPSNLDDLYPSWNQDMDLRTVFCDDSRFSPPHHLERMYSAPADDTAGTSYALMRALATGSPNWNLHRYSNTSGSAITASVDFAYSAPSQTGAFVPWFVDPRLPSGSIVNMVHLNEFLGSSPPPGWLTGPGGTAAVNEFPTTGSNLGPPTMRPFMPLLEDVYERYVTKYPLSGGLPVNPVTWSTKVGSVGFRPGLRGTQVQGTWRLMLATATKGFTDEDVGSGHVPKFLPFVRAGVWFRQFRLEFIIDQGEDVTLFNPATARKYAVPAFVRSRPGNVRRHIVSGTATWCAGTTYVYTRTSEEYGRSVGITSDTMSNVSDFAVFSRLTGTLVGALSGASLDNLQAHYLSNEFGTPYIPLSSGSGENPSFLSFDPDDDLASRTLREEVLRPRTLIGPSQTLRSTLSRTRFIRSARDQVLDRLTAIGTYGNRSGSLVPL